MHDNEDARLNKMQDEFLERHKDADDLIVGEKSSKVLGAIYYSPHEMWMNRTWSNLAHLLRRSYEE